MKKLKILWKNRKTWRIAFEYWSIVLFPHLHRSSNWYYGETGLRDDVWWFWESLNNFNNIGDGDT